LSGTFVYTRTAYTKDGLAFRLRPAQPADTEAIIATIQAVCAEQIYLHTNTFVLTEEWRQVLAQSVDEDNGRLLIVAQVGDEVVGYMRLFAGWYGPKGRHVGEVGLVLIKPWRERGIGTGLAAYALDWARSARFQKVNASVIATNQRALNLFTKFGFVPEGRRAAQFNIAGQYVDEILMGRFLNGHNIT
jgi:RimJ/RimL family protein N-acetyltransferase